MDEEIDGTGRAASDRLVVRLALAVLLASGLLQEGCSRTPPPADSTDSQRVADAFLAQLRAGQFQAAWESTTAEFKSDEGRESFIREVKSKPVLLGPLTLVGYEVTELNGLKRGQCTYEPAAGAKSPAGRVRVIVAQEAGQYRVDGIFVD